MTTIILTILGLICGLAMGLVIIFFLRFGSRKGQDIELVVKRLKESFGELSLDALSKITSEFQKFSSELLSKQLHDGEKDLDGKKKLIDQTLGVMNSELERLQTLVINFEKDREQKYGEVASQLKAAAEQTTKLQETTSHLRNTLASRTARGQWGQRMAEDVLRLAGFIEDVNYHKEKVQDTVNTRPDYTFLLPQGLKVNMDVKFPLDNYLRYTEAEIDSERDRCKEQFLRDARMRIKEVTNRSYINPEENTVDYVIVFIPNEQAYAFINENDRNLLDEALRNKVIVCSPLTLYAILAVIRQAVDNFNLEKSAKQILSLLGAFNKQWDAFIKSFDKLGRKLKETQDEYNNLTSTRRDQLERPIKKIEDLRRQQGIPEPQPADDDVLIIENSKETGDES
ncbi:MAG: recombinase RmuC [Omnitrophica bacterium RIFCSPLOWO2_01_FULL_45_10]|nr:MAG: recombinase RmuC [Omnitrophica bacterium RIFCSPLOWO2_01_FULL_45_10]